MSEPGRSEGGNEGGAEGGSEGAEGGGEGGTEGKTKALFSRRIFVGMFPLTMRFPLDHTLDIFRVGYCIALYHQIV